MQENPDVSCKEEVLVLDLTADSDDEFVKQEKSDDEFDQNCTISPFSNNKDTSSSSSDEKTTQLSGLQRSKSSRNFDQTLEKAIIVIKKGGSLDETAMKFGIPKDVIYQRLTSRSLPRENDVLTSVEEFNLVQWILRANKNNSIVFKNDLLFKVGKMKKVADITPVFAKSKFGKMWYDHFMRHHPEIYENDGILMPSEIGLKSSSQSSSSKSLSETLTILEEMELVDWIIEMNRQNKLVFKHDLLVKVQKLKKFSPMFVKSHGKKWYKDFLKFHPEIYENEELLMPSAIINPDNSRELKNDILPEPFPIGPLKLNKESEPVVSTQKENVLNGEGLVIKEESCFKRSRTVNNEDNCTKSYNVPGDDLDVNTENVRELKKIKTGAEETEQHMCTECNKTLSSKSKLKRHLAVHIPKEQYQFECDICNKKFPSKYHVSVHVKFAHSNKVHHCHECDSVFKHNTSLRKHVRSIHLNSMEPTSFICDICEKRFTYKGSLKDHIIYQHLLKKKKYQCSICSKRFLKYSLMLRHKLRHGTAKPFACNNCTKSFSRKYLLREHSKQCNKQPFLGEEDCDRCPGEEDCDKFLGEEDCDKFLGEEDCDEFLGEEDCEKISIEYLNKLDLD